MPKSPDISVSDSSSSSEDSDSSMSDRGISGQKFNSDSDDDADVKDQYLLEIFKPKPVKVVVSHWAKKKMRSAFLGTKVGKEEMAQLRDDYYCSSEDYKLFAPGKLADSPLSLLQSNNSSANKDLVDIHGLLLFGLRIGLISYEKILALAAMWAKQSIVPENGKVIEAGPWFGLSYRFRSNYPVPIPHKIRESIPDDEVDAFLAREFVEKAAGVRDEKLEVVTRYALSYRSAFEKMQEYASQAHEDAIRLEDALNEVKNETHGLAKDTGSSMRILGGVCQQVKAMREQAYTKTLDEDFKSYLTQRKRARTTEENVEARAAPSLLDGDLAKQAKSYGKLKAAMDLVTREKKKAKQLRKKQAAQNTASGAPTPGPSGFRPRGQPKKKDKGKKDKGKSVKGKSFKKSSDKKKKAGGDKTDE